MEQHMIALAQANEKRFAQARLKKEVASGELTVSELLLDVPDCLSVATGRPGISLVKVLSWQRQWGTTRARTWLIKRGFGFHAEKSVWNLSWRTRKDISDRLKETA